MKIIEHSKKETKPYRQFACKKCGCVFQCEEDEYWSKPQYEVGLTTACYTSQKTFMTCCPECHKVVEDYEYDNVKCTYSNTGDFDGDNDIRKKVNITCNQKENYPF